MPGVIRDHPDFGWLVAGRGVDSLGNAMYPVALGFAVLEVFDSLTTLGIVVGAGAVGLVAFLLVGGVVADRLSRRSVLVRSNHLAALAQTGIVALAVSDTAVLAPWVVLSFVTGAAAAFDHPASTALTPELLPKDALHRGNSLLKVTQRATGILGAGGAGIVVGLAGSPTALAVNAVSFALAGVCFARIRVPDRQRPTSTASAFADLRDGWTEFRSRTWVWVVVAAFFVINACWTGGFHVLGLAIAEDSFGPEAWGLILAAEGVGAVVGALVGGRWDPVRPMLVGMVAAGISIVPLVPLAMASAVPVLVLAALAAGMGTMVFAVAWESALQRHIPIERLARVSSWDAIGSFSAIPIGSFLVGPLAEAHGARTVVGWTAVLGGAACLAALLSRDVRRLPSQPGTVA